MKQLAIAGAAGLFLCMSMSACIDPSDRRPGLRLSGEVVAGPVQDWSFSHAHREIWIETKTPYLIPHSVTIICADADGQLFVAARNPEGKSWVRWVDRDPDVRLKIGDKVYEGRLAKISEPADLEKVRAAYAAKLGRPMDTGVAAQPAAQGTPPPPPEVPIRYWRVEPRTTS
jgi:hypothetical protein